MRQIFEKQCRFFHRQKIAQGLYRYWELGRWLYHHLPGEGALTLLAPEGRSIGPPLGDLRQMRRLYALFPDWDEAPRALRWSHCRLLLPIQDALKRNFYLEVCQRESWSAAELSRHLRAGYYERYIASPASGTLQKEDLTPVVAWLKDPLVLEFLPLSHNVHFSETLLEDAIIAHLPTFLRELGPGLAFVARQKRLAVDSGKVFYADLVLYHIPSRRFVILELKAGALTHRDIGQMDFYVRLYDAKYRSPGDQPTVGLILCSSKDDCLERYSALCEQERLFALRYILRL